MIRTCFSAGPRLRYSITPPDSALAKGIIESIKRGDLRGSSFSFTVNRDGQRWVTQGKVSVREIHSVEKLYDIGPVTFPAYDATTTGTRAHADPDEARHAYEAWRKNIVLALADTRARCAHLGLA
jgi:phage head maturation protease